jgi:hypothetical protein
MLQFLIEPSYFLLALPDFVALLNSLTSALHQRFKNALRLLTRERCMADG